MELGNLAVDFDRFTVKVGTKRVDLTYLEFEALRCLLDNRGALVARDELVHQLWGESSTPPRTLNGRLNTHISRLRQKLSGSEPWVIETVPKRGYLLTTDED